MKIDLGGFLVLEENSFHKRLKWSVKNRSVNAFNAKEPPAYAVINL
jgi:hypothetical protein